MLHASHTCMGAYEFHRSLDCLLRAHWPDAFTIQVCEQHFYVFNIYLYVHICVYLKIGSVLIPLFTDALFKLQSIAVSSHHTYSFLSLETN